MVRGVLAGSMGRPKYLGRGDVAGYGRGSKGLSRSRVRKAWG